MDLALEAALAAGARGEVPVGAVVTGPDGAVLAVAGNQTEADHDASAHAELLALRQAAAALASPRLPGCDLWVTLEPCPMCATAAALFRVRRVIFGAYDPKGGGIEHGPRVYASSKNLCCPQVIGGMRETQASQILKAFFEQIRRNH
jgi:tRNA(Arg) A34 adenosine deaminase TadA